MPFFKTRKPKALEIGNWKLEIPDSSEGALLPTSQIIKLSRQGGADFGTGNPNERIRYFIKLGLLPYTVRKIQKTPDSPTTRQPDSPTARQPDSPIGHLPAWTVNRLIEITNLNKRGLTFPQIAQKLKHARQPDSPIARQPMGSADSQENDLALSHTAASPHIVVKLASNQSNTNINKKLNEHEKKLKSYVEEKFRHEAQVTSFVSSGLSQNPKKGIKLAKAFALTVLVFSLTAGLVFTTGKGLLKNKGFSLGNKSQNQIAADIARSGQVLAATSERHKLYIDADMQVSGTSLFTENITAPNVVYGVTGGTGITVTGGQNPTVSLDSTEVVTSVNKLSGTLTLKASGSTTLSTSGSEITISSSSTSEADTLSTVTGRGATTTTAVALNGGLTSSSATPITLSSTAPILAIGNTGTLAITDGTNTMLSLVDQGAYGTLRLVTKGSTSDPSTCTAGDIYFNGTDTTVKACTATDTWEALDNGAAGMTSFTLSGDGGTDQTITDSNTLEIAGGVGITTAGTAGDILTVTFASTEVGTTTWGTATGTVWTFESGATDPSFTFASNSFTLGGAATVTATDVTAFNCTDCLDFDDVANSPTLDETTDINLSTLDLYVDLTSSGVLSIRDVATAFWTFDDDSTVDVVFPAAGTIGIDGATTANTTTAGVLDLNVTSATDNNRGIDLAYTFNNTSASTNGYGIYSLTTHSNTTNANTVYGQYSTLVDAVALANTNFGIAFYGNITGDGAVTKNSYGIYSDVLSDNTTTDQGIRNTYAGYFSARGSTNGTNTTYGVYTTASGGDNNYNLYGAAISTAGTANYGIYLGALSGATTSKGIEIGTNSSATAIGLAIGALSGSTANTGINIGAISGTGTGTGITIGNITSTGTTDYGLHIGGLSGASTNNYGINIGNISAATGLDIGINLGTLGGGTASSVYGIRSGTLTAVASGVNAQADLGAITGTAASSNNYGIRTGTIDSTGTANYGIYVSSVTGATDNYGLYVAVGSTRVNLNCSAGDQYVTAASTGVLACGTDNDSGATAWSSIGAPVGSLSLTFDDAEINTFTVSSDTEDFWTMNAASLASGAIFKLSGHATVGITDGLVDITSDVGAAGSLIELNTDFSGAGVTGYGIYQVATDTANNANTDYGDYLSLSVTGSVAGTKTAYGIFSTVTNTESANQGTRNSIALYGNAVTVDAGASNTTTMYGLYGAASGGDTNYGLYVSAGTAYIAGSADGTDALILNAGDILLTNGDLDLSGGDFNVTLDATDSASFTNSAASGATAALTVANTTAATDTAGSESLDIALTVANYADDNAADTHVVLDILATNNATDAGTNDNVYGIRVQELAGSATSGAEYGIYQAGTAWDYGLYITDASYIGATAYGASLADCDLATQTLAWSDTGAFGCGTDNDGTTAVTLQNAYDNSTSPATITLSSTDDALVFTNPSSAGVDTGTYAIYFSQANTTAGLSVLDIVQSSNAADAVNITADSIDTENALDISANGLTTGTALNISSTGTITTTGELLSLTANSLTSGAVVRLSATSASFSGTGIEFTGSSSTGITGKAISLTSDVGSAGRLIDLAPDFSGAGVTGYGIYQAATDATTAANVDYGLYSALTLTNNAAKVGYPVYGLVTSNSTPTADSLYGGYFKTSVLSGGNAARTTNYGSISYGQTTSTTADSVFGAYGATVSSGAATSGTQSIYGLYGSALGSGAISGATKTAVGVYGFGTGTNAADTNGTTSNVYGAIFNAVGENAGSNMVSNAYGVFATASVAATNYNLYGAAISTAGTANYGLYLGALSGATTSKGVEIGTNSSATAIGLAIGALSGTTANTGINIGAISGTGTGTGITIGNITSTGANNYGLLLGTLTGGTSGNFQISTGVLTSATTTANAQINLGGVVTTGGTTNYGINIGALSGTGTTNYGINVAALTSVGTNSYGINIGGLTGASTALKYGVNIGAISGTTTSNYGLALSTLTGGSTNNIQIQTGAITDTGTLNIALDLGGLSGSVNSSTNYGIRVGAITSAGTTSANYGIFTGNVSGATNNYGIVASATTNTANYALYTTAGNIKNILGATDFMTLDNTTAVSTNSTTATATLYVNSKSLTSGNTGASFAYTSTVGDLSGGSNTQYGIYNSFTDTTAVSGTSQAQTQYGLYNILSKSGVDNLTTGSTSTTGIYTSVTNSSTGTNNAILLKGGDFNVTTPATIGSNGLAVGISATVNTASSASIIQAGVYGNASGPSTGSTAISQYGVYGQTTDNNALANTNIGVFGTSNIATATGIGTGYGGYFTGTNTTSADQTLINIYGLYGGSSSAGASTTGTINNVAALLTATNTTQSGGTGNLYGALITGITGWDAGTGQDVNSYGVYIANPTNATKNYGVYMAAQTGGFTSDYGIYLAGADDYPIYLTGTNHGIYGNATGVPANSYGFGYTSTSAATTNNGKQYGSYSSLAHNTAITNTGATLYNIASSAYSSSTAADTRSSGSLIRYTIGLYGQATKSGADSTGLANQISSYNMGVYGIASNTSTDASSLTRRHTYGGYFNAAVFASQTSTSYGVYGIIPDPGALTLTSSTVTEYGSFFEVKKSGADNFTTSATYTQVGSYANITNSSTENIAATRTNYGNYSLVTDSTATAVNNYGIFSSVPSTGNGAKMSSAFYGNVSSNSTTADTLYGAYLKTSATGDVARTTNYGALIYGQSSATVTGDAVYGLHVYALSGAAANLATHNSYGVYSLATNGAASATATAVNAYGGIFSAVGISANVTTGTAYGVFADATGGDANFQFYSGSAFANTAATSGLCWDNSGASGILDCSTPVGDYAEVYPTENDVDYGEIVTLGITDVQVDRIATDENGTAQPGISYSTKKLTKSSTPYQSNVIGITSKNWADFSSTGHGEVRDTDHPIPIALSGRVPVKVTDENGPIAAGDLITTSSTAGVAMRADPTKGTTIGKALSDFAGPGQGEIIVFVQTEYRYNLATALQNTDLAAQSFSTSSGSFSVDASGNVTTNGQWQMANGNFLVDTLGNITTNGTLSVAGSQFTVDSLGNIQTSGSITAQSLNILGDTQVAGNLTASSLTINSELITNNLTALAGNDLTISLSGISTSTMLRFTDAMNHELLTINSTGNANFAGTVSADAFVTNSTADLAENFETTDNTVEAGDIVAADPDNPENIIKSKIQYQQSIIGVISTAPGLTLNSDQTVNCQLPAMSEAEWSTVNCSAQPLALAGRVPTKVSLENGPIKTGDPITSSSTPGVGMKATQPGRVIGIALQSYDCSSQFTVDSSQQENTVNHEPSTDNPICQGQIVVFVNPSWYTGASLAQNGSFTSQSQQSTSQSQDSSLSTLTLTSPTNPDGTLANSQNDERPAEGEVRQGRLTTKAEIEEIVRLEVQKQVGEILASSYAPGNSSLDSPVPAVIDSQSTPEVKDQTPSCNTDLTDGTDDTDSTDSTDSTVLTDSTDPPTCTDSPESSASAAIASGQNLTAETQSTLDALSKLLNTKYLILDTLSVTGNSNLASTNVAGTFSQDGTFIIDYGRQINALGNTLYLQNDPLAGPTARQPYCPTARLPDCPTALLDIGNGKFTFDRTGTLSVSSVVANKLTTKELVIDTTDENAKSAGSSTLIPGKTKVTIFTTSVKPNAKILITPTTPTGGKQLYVATKAEFEGFTVALDGTAAASQIEFDWLIVNTSLQSQL